eukprot:5072745-Pleurochrysis_carterae.AAC.5
MQPCRRSLDDNPLATDAPAQLTDCGLHLQHRLENRLQMSPAIRIIGILSVEQFRAQNSTI